MRFRNSSSLVIPWRLWTLLAAGMKMDDALPGALADTMHMYPSTTLRVTVHKERPVPAGRRVTTGSYAFGHIVLSPCANCTPGFLTQVYLHELVHAWLHQHEPELYTRWHSCHLAERFANAGFRVLGGKKRSAQLCASYSLPSRITLARIYDFNKLAKSLIEDGPATVQTWRPRLAKEMRVRLEH